MRSYFVYIAGSHSGTLYVGVTNDINRRMHEHREGLIPGFTKTYGVKRLLYVEATDDVQEALEREKQIKRWRREKKEHLIAMQNPKWHDLSRDSSTPARYAHLRSE